MSSPAGFRAFLGRRWVRSLLTAAALMAVLVAWGVFGNPFPFWLASRQSSPGVEQERPWDRTTSKVRRGPLSLVLSEKGSLECVKQSVLVSKVEWTTRLTEILPEGTFVKKGDIVARLDVSKLKDEYGEEQVDVLKAETALETARQNLKIQQLENENALASARLAVELARLTQDGYRQAEYPQQVQELEQKIAEAMDALHSARDQVAFTERLVQKDIKTFTELNVERVKLMQAQSKHADLLEQLRVLREHTAPRTMAENDGLLAQAEQNLEQQRALVKTTMISRNMQIEIQERRLLRQKQQFNWAVRMLKQCDVVAPHDGQVVYPEHGRDWDDQISEGMEVRFLHPLVLLPDRSEMQVQVRVHESLRRLLREDMPAVIELDSAPGRKLKGHVTSVSAFPLTGHWPNRDRREYEVTVRVDRDGADLAPGLTAKVDLIAAARDDALQAPLSAVTEIGDRHVAFVRTPTGIAGREVVLGVSTKDNVEVLTGLSEGERVVLSPRVHCPEEVLAWLELHEANDLPAALTAD